MAHKRKKSDTVLQMDTQPDKHTEEPQRPCAARRRSTRIEKQSQAANPSADAVGRVSSHSTRPTKNNGEMTELVGDVIGAMDNLREMENNFRNTIKRQKMALRESSVLSNASNSEEESAFLPRPHKANPDSVPADFERTALGEKKKPERNKEDRENNGGNNEHGANQNEELGDKEKGSSNAVGETDANALKQEGSRPPPVNSDYLPLPWKGRLGYVNSPDSHD